jgi:hypothetical protein
MYFHDGRDLNQRQYTEPEACNRINSSPPPSHDIVCEQAGGDHSRFKPLASPAAGGSKTVGMLDSANNKLQKLMQLLYLLSRDPAVPKDARYHVTVAQSEIALLARLMQNSAEGETGEGQPTIEGSSSGTSYRAAAPK